MGRKKLSIIIIILAIILILGAVGVLTFLFLTTDTFKSADQIFWQYFMQNQNILDVVENENTKEQANFKETNTYTSNGSLMISILGENETSQDINIETLTNHDDNTGRTYSEAILKNADTDLLKLSYINSGDVYAIKCEEVLQYYIGIKNSNLKGLGLALGISESDSTYIPDSINIEEILSTYTLTESDKKYIADTYVNIILETIPKENYSKLEKSQITVSGKNYNSNVYNLTLDGETLKQIIVNCLEKLKNDQVILSILEGFTTTGETGEVPFDSTGYTNEIDKLINTIQESSITNTISITVYENAGSLLRTVLDISEVIKITADISITSNTKNANITIENNSQEEITTSTKINLSKITAQTEIINNFEIIPDANKPEENIIMTTSLSSIQNDTVINSMTATINENDTKTITATYDKTIQAVGEVEEILELKNSNTVILNNYTKEQLTPFMQGIVAKIGEVAVNKIPQLGIDLSQSTSEDILKIVGTAGMCIINENGIDYDSIITTVPVIIGVNLFTATENAISDSTLNLEITEE